MSEISRKVIPYEFNYICDKCKNGMMMAVGERNENNLVPHKCMICAHKADLKKSYPHIEYYGEDEKVDSCQ